VRTAAALVPLPAAPFAGRQLATCDAPELRANHGSADPRLRRRTPARERRAPPYHRSVFVAFFRVVRHRLGRPLPLLRYLVFTTETHALCGALAFFAMLGFYPLSLLLITVARRVLRSPAAHDVVHVALREYYPTAQEFLLRNLEVSSSRFGEELTGHAAVWILLGGAGVFIPLETAFNRIWGFANHRPYWRNQWVGFLLASLCCGLLVLLLLGVAQVWGPLRTLALRASMIVFGAVAIFLLYQLLPNGRVPARVTLPAAVLAALAAEVVRTLYLLFLPWLSLPKSQGPYHVSISFLLFAYFEAFVVLAGAYLAADAAHPEAIPPLEEREHAEAAVP
jgi:uncharacterized BrkB/YihY/UPF0761 family membrane protein